MNDFFVNADIESGQFLDTKNSDQDLWNLMLITGKCEFCEFKHPVSYNNMEERLDCESYPDRGSQLYEYMDTYHADVTKRLEEY